jgi:hypothetical protein
MRNDKHRKKTRVYSTYLFTVLLWVPFVARSVADEAGVSFWLPGQYGSYAAVPLKKPGWSFESAYYHAKARCIGT